MDIGNLTTDYSDYLTSSNSGSTSAVQNAAKSVNGSSTDEELMDVCKQFESYLLEQVFKEMEKTVSFGDEEDEESSGMSMSGSSNALTDYFKDQTIAEIAGTSTDREGLGIAQMLYESMKRNG